MAREGPLDPLFGQRSCFPPQSLDSDMQEWLDKVRKEALEIHLKDQVTPERQESVSRRPAAPTISPLIYEKETKIDIEVLQKITFEKYDFFLVQCRDLSSLWEKSRMLLSQTPKTSHLKEVCDTQSTWKAYIASNYPPSFDVSVDHVTIFRLMRYLSHWGKQRNISNYALWAWSLILRCPDLLTADEIGLLRDLSRVLEVTAVYENDDYESRVASTAFKEVLIRHFGQLDLQY